MTPILPTKSSEAKTPYSGSLPDWQALSSSASKMSYRAVLPLSGAVVRGSCAGSRVSDRASALKNFG
eukprot:16382002-Heterocapsa_arctica.AAC.1